MVVELEMEQEQQIQGGTNPSIEVISMEEVSTKVGDQSTTQVQVLCWILDLA